MKKLIIVILFLLKGIISFAQVPYTPINVNRVLMRAFPFQNFTYTAREAALAEAGIAINPDSNSGFMNPAKFVFLNSLKVKKVKSYNSKKDSIVIDSLKPFGLSINYTPYYRNLIEGMNLWGINGFKVSTNRAYGATIRYFDAGTTAIYADSKQFMKNFKSKEFSFTGFYSFKFSQNKKNSLSLGLKYTYSNLSSMTTTKGVTTKPVHAIAGDIYFYHNGKNKIDDKAWLNYGASITSIGGKVSYGDYKKKSFQPTLLKIGVAQHFIIGNTYEKGKENILMLTIDANKLLVPTPPVRDINNNVLEGKDETFISGVGSIFQSWGTAPDGLSEHLREIYYSMGAELQIKQTLFARAGYYTQNKHKGDIHYFSLGLGVKLKAFSLDFAYLFPTISAGRRPNQILLNTYRISLNYCPFK
jgi:hypothetical protein